MAKVIKRCLECKQEFSIYPYRKDSAKYCSHDCYGKTVYLQLRTDKWYEVMKDIIPWNKGKKWSKEIKEKMSKAQKRRFEKENSWNKGMRGYMAGKKHYRWKGITPKDRLERMRFRNEIQKKVFERDNYTCQICGERGGKLQVDHIQSWAEYVELRFDINNCRTVCMCCHYEITFGKPMPKKTKAWGHNLKEVQGL